MDNDTRELVIPGNLDGRRLDQALCTLLPDHSRSRIKQWILDGCVALDGGAAEPRTRVAQGQAVTIRHLPVPEDEAAPARAEPLPLAIVHEDAHLIIIDKPAGLVVHPGAGNRSGTLENGLLAHDPRLAELPRSGLIHRLDKDTSGLLVVARTPAAHTALVRDLEARQITREYRAVCVGRMTAGGTVDAPISRHPSQRTRMAIVTGGRPAVTHYRVLARFAHHTLVAVRLETGRTHQIRVHMAHVRHPLLGDPAYGGRLIIPAGSSAVLADALRAMRRQALHASRLMLRHPVSGAALDFTAALPGDFLRLLVVLSGGEAAAAQHAEAPWPDTPPRR